MKRKPFRPKKRLGQHFLTEPAIARRIVEAADPSRESTVVELGAGRGILTRPLIETGARVVALEVDEALCDELTTLIKEDGHGEEPTTRVEVVRGDFTRISLTALLASRGLEGCVLVGNIPYNLTREVLFSYLVDEAEVIRSAYLMMQKEVAERIVSPPGGRIYGITSVALQSLYAVRSLFRVSPGSFRPRPRVDSMVLEFTPLEEPLVEGAEIRRFIQFVRHVFQQRRKTLHNTIKQFYSARGAELRAIHAATGIDLGQRPEVLSKEELLRLSRAVAEVLSNP